MIHDLGLVLRVVPQICIGERDVYQHLLTLPDLSVTEMLLMNVTVINLTQSLHLIFAILPLETGADKKLHIEDVKADTGLFAPCSVL